MQIEEFWEPIEAKVTVCDDGQKRWVQSTRDGDEVVGLEGGKVISLVADAFEAGTVVSYHEPMTREGS